MKSTIVYYKVKLQRALTEITMCDGGINQQTKSAAPFFRGEGSIYKTLYTLASDSKGDEIIIFMKLSGN